MSANRKILPKPSTMSNSNDPNMKCLICCKVFENIKERKKHFNNDDKIPLTIFKCMICRMHCPSKCYLKAHQKIHCQDSPYVCPECGDFSTFSWANFQQHLIDKCCHYARGIGYKCPECRQFFPSYESLLEHMKRHMKPYMKCFGCIRAYDSIASFEAHGKEFHKNNTTVKYEKIYVCSLCNTVLTHDVLLQHSSSHLETPVREYVFNCVECENSFKSEVLLLDHIKSSHTLCQHPKQNEINHELTQPTVIERISCVLCHCSYNNQGYNIHLEKVHADLNKSCCLCQMIVNRNEMLAHGKRHLMSGHVICLLCNNKKFQTKETLRIHLSDHVNKLQYCSLCPVCKKIMPTNEALGHLLMEHLLKDKNCTSPVGTKQDPKSTKSLGFDRGTPGRGRFNDGNRGNFRSGGFNDRESDRGRGSGSFGGRPTPNKAPVPEWESQTSAKEDNLQEHFVKCYVAHPRQDILLTASEIRPPTNPRLHISKCAKCNFKSIDRKTFKEHLLIHKTVRNTFQCLECGFCFVDESTVAKHLKIVHRISNTKKYLKEEGSHFMLGTGKEAEVPCYCTVCFKTLPNKTLLNLHSRTHGMEYIKKLSKANKN